LILSIFASAVIATQRPKKPDPPQRTFMKPIFVIEMLSEGQTDEKGELSKEGLVDAFKLGMKRKEEYGFLKPLISKERYKPEQILSLSTDSATTDTGYKMLQGLYPMVNWRHPLNVNFLAD
jgi:hypothetical protein